MSTAVFFIDSSPSAKLALVERIRANVPSRLLELPVWLLHDAAKLPIYADGRHRSGTLDAPADRSRLVPYEQAAVALVQVAQPCGLGIALGDVPGHAIRLCGIDLDGCYQGEQLDERTQAILGAAKSYTERSLRGRGLHILGTGDIGTLKLAGLEIYSGARYFTMTGQRLAGSELVDISEAAFIARELFSTENAAGSDTRTGHAQGQVFEGQRNDYLSRKAYRLRREGATVEQIGQVLLTTNAALCIPPLLEQEVRAIATGKARIEPEAQGLAGAQLEVETGVLAEENPAKDASWPALLAVEAYQGLIGDIVHAIEPQTESDPAAILIQTLVALGAVIGRGPHVRVEGDEHHAQLYAVLVGATAKARKGTSWGRVREIFSRVGQNAPAPTNSAPAILSSLIDAQLTDETSWPRVVDGLSSSEGLKWQVRDSITRRQKNAKTGITEDVVEDDGIADKRLLVVESEFSQVLRQAARAGNTLSPAIRAAWDTGTLMSLTKNDPITATGAHICLIGHITAQELRVELTGTDAANGFANRILFCCVRRSRVLPFGGERLADDVAHRLAERITQAALQARTLATVQMTNAAREIWARVYPCLSEGRPGLLGAVTARAEAQCLRLALLYALADRAREIDAAHLNAALEVWRRCEDSARFTFGSALGDPIADNILRALRTSGSTGMTRTEINNVFKRHQSAERIGAALELLGRRGLATHHQQPAQGGRPAEVWGATNCEKSERGEKS